MLVHEHAIGLVSESRIADLERAAAKQAPFLRQLMDAEARRPVMPAGVISNSET